MDRSPDAGAPIGADVPPAAESIARGLQRGEAWAIAEVEGRVGRILAFRGYRIPPQDREDLGQEVMTQVWQAVKRPGFDPGGGFLGFVELVTARRSVDWLRAQRQEAPLGEGVADSRATPAEETMDRERTRLAAAAVDGLEAPCRELIRLHVGLGKGYREISRLLGRSEGALRTQMHRCIQTARRLLEQEEAVARERAEPGDAR